MHVVATAGHVDHGKSTLVRALTGMEPDRWEQERRRGLTIDLGYAWAPLAVDAGRAGRPGQAGRPEQAVRPGESELEHLAFVDVPGHRRFIGNMLAGLGPAPAVMLVVAADEGWMPQSEEHLLAAEALRLRHGVVVVTRSDLADPGPALAQARERLSRGPLGWSRGVAVSAPTGQGLTELQQELTGLVRELPEPDRDARVRLWVDRAFTVRGSGTVVTGTLEAGTLRTGQDLALAHRASDGSGTGQQAVTVRGLQTLGAATDQVSGPARVAVNLRGLPVHQVQRGDLVLSPDAWPLSGEIDVRLDAEADDLPAQLTLHVGALHLPARLRRLQGSAGRLLLDRPLPLQAGDRAILRVPGVEGALTGLEVVDVSPPRLTRTGSARRRGEELLAEDGAQGPRLETEVARRGHLTVAEARLLGLDVPPEQTEHEAADPSTGARAGSITRLCDHLVSAAVLDRWRSQLLAAVDARAATDPLDPTLSLAAARDRAGLPGTAVVEALAPLAGLAIDAGRVARPGTRPDLGAAAAGLDAVRAQLAEHPFAAPEAERLAELGLGRRELAAAERNGDLLRIAEGVVLLPRSPALAMAVLVTLPQPFTTSQARQALQTSRRVAIPLLEHLDARGWTRRVDATHRVVDRSRS